MKYLIEGVEEPQLQAVLEDSLATYLVSVLSCSYTADKPPAEFNTDLSTFVDVVVDGVVVGIAVDERIASHIAYIASQRNVFLNKLGFNASKQFNAAAKISDDLLTDIKVAICNVSNSANAISYAKSIEVNLEQWFDMGAPRIWKLVHKVGYYKYIVALFSDSGHGNTAVEFFDCGIKDKIKVLTEHEFNEATGMRVTYDGDRLLFSVPIDLPVVMPADCDLNELRKPVA